MKPIDVDIHTISKEDLTKYELVDIREAEEIEVLPPLKACRHIPLSEFPGNIHQFKKDKPYLLYCAKGGRSHYLAEILNAEGYEAYSVNNGISSLNAYFKKLYA